MPAAAGRLDGNRAQGGIEFAGVNRRRVALTPSSFNVRMDVS